MLSKTMRRSNSETLGEDTFSVPDSALQFSFQASAKTFEAAPSGLFFSESWTVCAAVNSIHNYKAMYFSHVTKSLEEGSWDG